MYFMSHFCNHKKTSHLLYYLEYLKLSSGPNMTPFRKTYQQEDNSILHLRE